MTLETRSLLSTAVLAVSLTLVGCGSSGDSANTGSAGINGTGSGHTTQFQGITGPLDVIQQPLSEQVLAQISGAVMGTPLEAAIDCVDQAVVQDLLDVADRLLIALQGAAAGGDPQAVFTAAAGDIQAAVTAFAEDLPGVLTGLAGEGCTGNGTATASSNSSNPLAGTPLAALGDALAPVLAAFPTGNTGSDLQLTSLSALVTQLNLAFQQGLAMIPAEAQAAPVAGGLFATLSNALNNVDASLQAAAIYDADATTVAVTQLVDSLLKDVLTDVVPITFIEAQAGQGPIVSSQIEAGIEQVSAALAQGLDPALDAVLEQALAGALSPVMDPIENTLLPAILAPITDALAGGLPTDGAGGAAGPTGTPLDAVLVPIMAALSGTGGGVGGPTGTPLDILLAPLADAIAAGGVGACPLADTPLDPLCSVVDSLLGGAVLSDLLGLLGLEALPLPF